MLVCRARVVNKGRRVAVVEANVETTEGQLVAVATGSYYLTQSQREKPAEG